ncbi:MAG: autotransporter-associated beta strand repeat-containing protein [Planctomycetota bacterium]|nr:autotransporter-associated beta strand repeat-containing protein [Planctomycetota bacterium]
MLSSVPLVVDGFADLRYAAGERLTAAAETVSGFAGDWQGTGIVTTEAGSLRYPGLGESGGLRVELANNALVHRQLDLNEASPLAPYVRAGEGIADSSDDKPLYIGFLWRVTGPDRPAAAVSLYLGGTASSDRVFRIFTSSTKPTFQAAVGSSTAAAEPLAPLDDGLHLFVVRIDFSDGVDTIRVWQNPTAGGPEPPSHAQFSYDLSFDRLALSRFGGEGTVAFDEYRMGSDWASVTNPGSPETVPRGPLVAEGFNQFDYPPAADVNGLAGLTPGFGGTWSTLGTATVVSESLAYPGYGEAGPNRIMLSGTDVVSRPLLPGNNGPLGNFLSPDGRLTGSRDESALFLSFLLQVSGPTAPAATFSLYDGGLTPDRRQLRVVHSVADQDFRLMLGPEATAVVPLGPSSEEPQLFVLRIDFNDGPDTVSIWRNPDLSQGMGLPDAAVDTFDLGFDRVAITRYQGDGIVAFDELRMGTRWADTVLAESLQRLPEPDATIDAMAVGPDAPRADGSYPAGFFPFIDEFGQYRYLTWPEKVGSSQDLVDRVVAETGDLHANPGPADFNVYGGWANGPQLTATGYFRVEKIGNRWWLVDPAGRLFFSHGITGVSDPDRLGGAAAAVKTGITGREHYFADLPLPETPGAEFLRPETSAVNSGAYQGDYPVAMNFFANNARLRYGSDWEVTSQNLAHERLRSWGMNTIGGFSDEDVYLQRRTPYTIVLYPLNASLINGIGTFPDYFDPQYRLNVVDRILQESGKSLGDSWLLGYFVHNELPWTRSSTEDIDVGLVTLGAAATQPAKLALLDLLRARYETVAALNAAWRTDYGSWTDLLERRTVVPDLAFAGRDLRDFDRLYAEQYFDATASALAEAAPSHLYLGARFTNGVRAPVAEASATRVDVLSINRYGTGVDTLPASLAADVPIIVSEFHFSANDTGLLSDGLRTVADQTARAEAYSRYLQTALNSDRVVGVHWLQYWDFPTSGRLNNSNNNSNLGFLTITDTPYAAMVEAARNIGAVIYESRAADLQIPAVVVPPGQTLIDPTQWSGTTRLVKQGEGTLILEQPNSHSGSTVVEAGTLVIRNPDALGTGTLAVRATATVRFDVGMSAVSLPRVELHPDALLDLGEAKVSVSPGGVDPTILRQAIIAGRNGGGWNGSSGVASTAASVSAGSRAIGYQIGSDGSATIMFTAVGDLNLDGQVDVFDLLAMDSGRRFGSTDTADWSQGDLDYDGRATIFDLLSIDAAGTFNTRVSAAAAEATAFFVPQESRQAAFASMAVGLHWEQAGSPAEDDPPGGIRRSHHPLLHDRQRF